MIKRLAVFVAVVTTLPVDGWSGNFTDDSSRDQRRLDGKPCHYDNAKKTTVMRLHMMVDSMGGWLRHKQRCFSCDAALDPTTLTTPLTQLC